MKQLTQKMIILFVLFAATMAYAFQTSLDEYHFIGVNMDLEQQNISGSAKRLKFEQIDEVNATLNGQIEGDHIELLINETPFTLSDLGGFFKEMENAKLIEFSFENGQKNAQIEISSIEMNSDKITNLTNLNGNCHVESNSQTEFQKFLINTCTTNSTLNVAEFKQNKNKFIENVLGLKSNGETRLTNLNLQVSNHNLRLQVKVHASLTVTAKIEGHIEYRGGSNEIAVRIDKARASFLNIKDKLFEEVEQMNEPSIRVERPYIYYQLGE